MHPALNIITFGLLSLHLQRKEDKAKRQKLYALNEAKRENRYNIIEEKERQRLAAEAAERQRLAAEAAERQRLAEDAERQRLAAIDAESKRLATIAEAARLAAEAEKTRLKAEAEATRIANKAEFDRLNKIWWANKIAEARERENNLFKTNIREYIKEHCNLIDYVIVYGGNRSRCGHRDGSTYTIENLVQEFGADYLETFKKSKYACDQLQRKLAFLKQKEEEEAEAQFYEWSHSQEYI